MLPVSLMEQGDCLHALGKLDQTAKTYQKAISYNEILDDKRGVAKGKIRLAMVYQNQKNYTKALQIYHEVLILFQKLDKTSAIAAIYRQIGMVYHQQSFFYKAEATFSLSLSMVSRKGSSLNEAYLLRELGHLYKTWGRPEQAISYYHQAKEITIQLGHLHLEGEIRANIAVCLTTLKRLGDARREIIRAIECNESFSHAAKPWVSWDILYHLEKVIGNQTRCKQALKKAVSSYLTYRRNGGENHSNSNRLALKLLKAIHNNDTKEVKQTIKHNLAKKSWQKHKVYLHNLLAILYGDRSPALAEHDGMSYQQIVVKLLLEQLFKLEHSIKLEHYYNFLGSKIVD